MIPDTLSILMAFWTMIFGLLIIGLFVICCRELWDLSATSMKRKSEQKSRKQPVEGFITFSVCFLILLAIQFLLRFESFK